MIILFLANNAAGLYAFRREIIEKLMEKGTVYVACPQGVDVDNLKSIGCRFIETTFDRHGKNPLTDLSLLITYIKLLNVIHPDVVLTYTIKPNIYGGIACAIRKIPYISNITGLGVALENKGIISSLAKKMYQIGLKNSYIVFFQNAANREYMINNGIVRGRNYVLPGSGINLDLNPFEEYPHDTGNYVFLIIGRIMKDKGIDEVLDAIEVIKKRHNNVTFKLIGGYDEDYTDKIEKASCDGLIDYIGYIDNVQDYIKDSHATINASYHEGMSNVLLETAAGGRPILASDIPGCRETVLDGKSGFLFKVKDAKAIVESVDKFLCVPYEKKAQMGIEGRKYIEKTFDRKIVVDKYVEIIREIMLHKKPKQTGDKNGTL